MPPTNLVRAFLGLWWTLGLVLLWLSARTAYHALQAGPSGPNHLLAIVAIVEALAALLFLHPRTMRAGGTGLLATFVIAFAIHAAHGEFGLQLIVYAAGVLFVIIHGPIPGTTSTSNPGGVDRDHESPA